MPSTHQALLVEVLRECCNEIQKQQKAVLTLHDHSNFSTSSFWVTGLAEEFKKILNDLTKWCDKFEKSERSDENDRYRIQLKTANLSASYINLITDDVGENIKAGIQEDLPPDKSIEILRQIEGHIKDISRQINMVKELDQAEAKDNARMREVIRQSQSQVNQIRGMFEKRLESVLPQDRDASFSIIGERGCVNIEHMGWFWGNIRRPPEMSRCGDKNNRFDGVLISDDHIRQARAVLVMFIEAWLAVHQEPIDRQSLDNMQHMPAIACVLYACGKHSLFNKFIAAEIKDSDLKFGHEAFLARVEEALQDKVLAREVVAQFSRIEPRPWPNGTNLILHETEPLPLCEIRPLRDNKGPVTVSEVRDARNADQHYALKVVRTQTAGDRQLADLRNEINKLTILGQEEHGHHIVKCIKTYERGTNSEIGMLLSPVASGDLNNLLNRCCQDYKFRKQNKLDLIHACGCLAYSLAYLHNIKEMRHRDVKPHNILVHQQSTDRSLEFLWADFGLAFVFRDQGETGEINPHFGATPEYEAPEIDPGQDGMHTRATDVFALGCVFLEIVWVLSLPERAEPDQIGLRHDFWEHSKGMYYKHHLGGLNKWIFTLESKLNNTSDRTKRLILQLAQKMILEDHNKRLKIGDVVMGLWKVKATEVNEKPFCSRCIEKMKTDLKENPMIFKHRSLQRRSVDRTVSVARLRLGSG